MDRLHQDLNTCRNNLKELGKAIEIEINRERRQHLRMLIECESNRFNELITQIQKERT